MFIIAVGAETLVRRFNIKRIKVLLLILCLRQSTYLTYFLIYKCLGRT